MIFGKTKLELKVGVFALVGLVILAFFILSIGKFRTWSAGYEFRCRFGFVNGVREGAPVRFAGVDVGEVRGINFIASDAGEPILVEVACWIKNGVRMPADSSVLVNTLGLLGEKYIEIMPGKDYSTFIQAGQTIRGRDPLVMDDVVNTARDIVNELQTSLERINNKEGTIGKLLYDDALYQELEGLISDVRRNPWKLFWKTKEKK